MSIKTKLYNYSKRSSWDNGTAGMIEDEEYPLEKDMTLKHWLAIPLKLLFPFFIYLFPFTFIVTGLGLSNIFALMGACIMLFCHVFFYDNITALLNKKI